MFNFLVPHLFLCLVNIMLRIKGVFKKRHLDFTVVLMSLSWVWRFHVPSLQVGCAFTPTAGCVRAQQGGVTASAFMVTAQTHQGAQQNPFFYKYIVMN